MSARPTNTGSPTNAVFPFSAVVGHDQVKLALVLAAVEPALGGVLLSGQKGSAKTTLARGVAALLASGSPFVELPLGASEDRLIGSIDLGLALTGGGVRFQPGLLAAAHRGVLYVDEVNLLADHLVDVLLDVAVTGVNRVEREGVSHTHASRFVLVGSMNPEEGDLRPQLLDRFGLSVDVATSSDPALRAEAVRRRMAFDADPTAFHSAFQREEEALGQRLGAAVPAVLSDDLVERVSRICVGVGAEGLRADLVICRAAAALAGWEECAETTMEHVGRVAPLALGHRQRRRPFDSPGLASQDLSDALAAAEEDGPGGPGSSSASSGQGGTAGTRVAAPGPPVTPPRLEVGRASAGADGRRSKVEGSRGRAVGDRVFSLEGSSNRIAVGATVRASSVRLAGGSSGEVDDSIIPEDLREAVCERRAANLVVLAVDASGSMGAPRRMEVAKAAVMGLLLDAYQRRDRVALVSFRADAAEVVLRPTGSIEVARSRLADLATGGRTPLAAGITAGLDLATAAGRSDSYQPLLVVVTDGRATAGPVGVDPLEAARVAAERVRRRGVPAAVVDAEEGPTRLGLAAELAAIMGARYLRLDELAAGGLRGLVAPTS